LLGFHSLDWAYKISGYNADISSWPFVPKKLQQINRQDMVFIRPLGISDGAFQLRMDNTWFCKLLLLFKIHTKTDTGIQQHDCAFISVFEEYQGPRKAGHIMHHDNMHNAYYAYHVLPYNMI
jgi:hypothetical protein